MIIAAHTGVVYETNVFKTGIFMQGLPRDDIKTRPGAPERVFCGSAENFMCGCRYQRNR